MRRRYHYRVKNRDQHHSLSVDISGPHQYAYDKSRFLVVFAYKGAALEKSEEGEVEEEFEDVGELVQGSEEFEGEEPEEDIFGGLDAPVGEVESDQEGIVISQVSVEEESVNKRKFFVSMVPALSKKEVAVVVMNRIAYIKGEMQLPITRLHSDRGNEFLNAKMKQFVAEQGIRQTVTTGGCGKQNGRAESAIGKITGLIRTMLHSGGVEKDYWSAAARTADYLLLRHQNPELKQLIPRGLAFGDRVIVKLYPTSSEVKDQMGQKLIRMGKYIGVYEGQCVQGGSVLTEKEEVFRSDTMRRIGRGIVEETEDDDFTVREEEGRIVIEFKKETAPAEEEPEEPEEAADDEGEGGEEKVVRRRMREKTADPKAVPRKRLCEKTTVKAAVYGAASGAAAYGQQLEKAMQDALSEGFQSCEEKFQSCDEAAKEKSAEFQRWKQHQLMMKASNDAIWRASQMKPVKNSKLFDETGEDGPPGLHSSDSETDPDMPKMLGQLGEMDSSTDSSGTDEEYWEQKVERFRIAVAERQRRELAEKAWLDRKLRVKKVRTKKQKVTTVTEEQARMQVEEAGSMKRTVDMSEVRKNIQLWIAGAEKEIKSLEEKGTVRRVMPERVEDEKRKNYGIKIYPAKLVCTESLIETVEEHQVEREFKRKVRIVACGNFAVGSGTESTFSATPDVTCLRVLLRFAAYLKGRQPT
jgi:hypothetical protein